MITGVPELDVLARPCPSLFARLGAMKMTCKVAHAAYRALLDHRRASCEAFRAIWVARTWRLSLPHVLQRQIAEFLYKPLVLDS